MDSGNSMGRCVLAQLFNVITRGKSHQGHVQLLDCANSTHVWQVATSLSDSVVAITSIPPAKQTSVQQARTQVNQASAGAIAGL